MKAALAILLMLLLAPLPARPRDGMMEHPDEIVCPSRVVTFQFYFQVGLFCICAEDLLITFPDTWVLLPGTDEIRCFGSATFAIEGTTAHWSGGCLVIENGSMRCWIDVRVGDVPPGAYSIPYSVTGRGYQGMPYRLEGVATVEVGTEEQCAAHSPTTLRVRQDGHGDFATIQDALDMAVDGDVIEVADGTYFGWENRDLRFHGLAVTVRSESGQPEDCIIDCLDLGRGASFVCGEGLDTVLRGLTIRNAMIAKGGGVYCRATSPTIEGCRFVDNVADDTGGGICADQGSPRILGCTFLNNNGDWGGGIACWGGSSTISGCTFTGNTATHGGGIVCHSDSTAVTNCEVRDCVSSFGGGGIWCEQSAAVISRSTFTGNTAPWNGAGGGVGCWHAAPDINECSFVANNGQGAIYGAYSSPLVRGCTLIRNGQGVYFYDCDPVVRGCTIHGCQDYGLGLAHTTLLLDRTIVSQTAAGPSFLCEEGGSALITCSDLYGSAGGDWIDCIANQQGLNGNLREDPLFCDEAIDDLRLAADSPCCPAHNPTCGLIGAWPVGCLVPARVESGSGAAGKLRLAVTPNPTTGQARFVCFVPGDRGASPVSLTIHDATGRMVRTLLASARPPGTFEVVWDGATDRGHRVPSGCYAGHLRVGGAASTTRVLVLR